MTTWSFFPSFFNMDIAIRSRFIRHYDVKTVTPNIPVPLAKIPATLSPTSTFIISIVSAGKKVLLVVAVGLLPMA